MEQSAPPEAEQPAAGYTLRRLTGIGYGIFDPDGVKVAWANTKAGAEYRAAFLNTPIPERPHYEVWEHRDTVGQPVQGRYDVLRANGPHAGQVIYRGVVSLDAAQRRAADLNNGEPEPRVRRHHGPNVYPVGWMVWNEGLHFKTLDEIKAYATRLFTSPWSIRYYGHQLVPEVQKQRGQGGHSYNGRIKVGFNGGYARQVVVLHELAHEVVGAAHDKRFNRVWLELMQHEMGEAMGRKLRGLYKEYRVKVGRPTKPALSVLDARERAKERASARQPLRLWRVEVMRQDRTRETGAFEARTMGGALLQAERQWRVDDLLGLRVWKGRASPARKPLRKAATRGRPA